MGRASSRPSVSVCVVTYNQERYIGKCLQTLVDQETDFDFEVVVGEDGSTDGTRAIVRHFQQSYPHIVKPIYHESNVGAMGNYLAVHRAALGEYVCHVDGDDWTRPNKLGRQKHYLDENPACPMVAHRMAIWEGDVMTTMTRVNVETIDLSLLLRGHPMFLHSSIMYRRSSFEETLSRDSTFIDFFFYVTAALNASIGFINEVLGDYRRNIGIASARNLMPYIQAAIDHAERHGANPADVRRSRSRSYLSYAVAALCDKNMGEFRKLIAASTSADARWLYPKLIRLAGTTPMLLRRLILIYKYKTRITC
jgi:Glycosyl transferase family 2